eukprot:TRINITY_DN2148_c0_g1_i2.p1 TRINITY_DN2148_c0_g1~~TRINITY_DN2148_c0_g1_i2.p1  ORF type:complete len:348 (-),score=135.43 TRINITY_DN2148_c0_g1_i2:55-981(-)
MKFIATFLVVALVLGTTSAQVSDLKQAWDAAFVSLIASGEYARISSVDPNNEIISDCFAIPEFYPFPPNPTGALARALERGSILVGNVGDSPGLPVSDTTTNPPTGWLPQLQAAIVKLISTAYNKPLTSAWVYYDGSDSAFTALAAQKIDIVGFDFSVGGFYNGSRRSVVFETSCTVGSSETSLYVPATSTLKTLADIKALPAAQLKIAVIGTGSYQSAKSWFPTANVVNLDSNTSPDDVMARVIAGEFSCSFDLEPQTPNANVRRIGSGVLSGMGGFFSRTTPSAPVTSAPAPSSNVNLNFGGLLQA